MKCGGDLGMAFGGTSIWDTEKNEFKTMLADYSGTVTCLSFNDTNVSFATTCVLHECPA